MPIPTEPIGSIPRPASMLEGVDAAAQGRIGGERLGRRSADAVRETAAMFAAELGAQSRGRTR